MLSTGYFGYIIGKKKRLIKVEKHADLLWQILVREIYVILTHLKTKEAMLHAFEKIKTTKCAPKKTDEEKFALFTNFEKKTHLLEWSCLLHFCQSSYINILEAGYIMNEREDFGHVFMIDFNKENVSYYIRDFECKKKEIQNVSFDEIMKFEEMPTKTYLEIVDEMKSNFGDFYEKYVKIEKELKNLEKLKIVSKTQNAVNIENKLDKLIEDLNWEKKKLMFNRRVFFTRLKALNLIEE